MKTFEVTIVVNTTKDFDRTEFILLDSDVIDGYELTRRGHDTTENFKMKSAYIKYVLLIKDKP